MNSNKMTVWSLLVFGLLNINWCEAISDDANIRETVSEWESLPYFTLLAIPLTVAAICVYIYIPKLQTLHGNCLLCFLYCLLFKLMILSIIYFTSGITLERIFCTSTAYIVYFTYLSTHIWMSVMSYNIWSSIRSILQEESFSKKRKFFIYKLFGYGLASLLTYAVYACDSIETLSNFMRPLAEGECFLQNDTLSPSVFLMIPNLVLIFINLTFFGLIVLEIESVKRHIVQTHPFIPELRTKQQEELNEKKQEFTSYLLLFTITGLIWNLQIAGFILPKHYFIFSPDLCNGIQGASVFVLLVLNKNTRRLIRERQPDEAKTLQKRRYMGVKMFTLTDDILSELRNHNYKISDDVKSGVFISAVVIDSPAFKCGLKVGDVIINVNGEEVYSTSIIYAFLPEKGRALKMIVCRGSERLGVLLVPEESS